MLTAASPRSKQSAGILAYRKRGAELEVFLVHPGGPYFRSKDEGAWSIPKGEYQPPEDALQAARREFQEETGFVVDGPFQPLPPIRQSGGKRVQAWAVESPDLDPARLRSNCFTLAGTRYAGTYPEVDRAGWFTLKQAQVKLLSGQRPLLTALSDAIGALGDFERVRPS